MLLLPKRTVEIFNYKGFTYQRYFRWNIVKIEFLISREWFDIEQQGLCYISWLRPSVHLPRHRWSSNPTPGFSELNRAAGPNWSPFIKRSCRVPKGVPDAYAFLDPFRHKNDAKIIFYNSIRMKMTKLILNIFLKNWTQALCLVSHDHANRADNHQFVITL